MGSIFSTWVIQSKIGLTKVFNPNLLAEALLLQQAESALSEEAHWTAFSFNPSHPILVRDSLFFVSLDLPAEAVCVKEDIISAQPDRLPGEGTPVHHYYIVIPAGSEGRC